jgi:mannose-6-phosphate isomerase-like protein (cupin superfamily)
MRTRVAGQEGELRAGEELEVPRGTVHQMWNGAEEPAVFRWLTMPAGRTLDWFREVAALSQGESWADGTTLLARYSDVFRLAEP